MWKNFFYFQRGQRIAIVALLAVIVIAWAAGELLPLWLQPNNAAPDDTFIAQVADFHSKLLRRDSVEALARRNRYKSDYEHYPKYENYTASHSLFVFDPNTADSTDFVSLGLKPYIASNIIKFRRNGGVFRDNDGFKRIYGITPEKFAELQPYINIQIAENQAESKINKSPIESEKAVPQYVKLSVELNIADTAELMQISGIGSTYARRIVAYRQKLGGFAQIEQLSEVYGMTAENLAKITPSLTVNTALLKQITINTATVDKLNAHPYINFYQAKAIYELRRRKIKLKSIDDLRHLDEMKETDIQRIAPYFSFE